MKRRFMSISIKLVLLVLLGTIISTSILGFLSYRLNRRDSIRMNAERALSISKAVALHVDPKRYAEIMESGQKNEYWVSLKEYLDSVLMENGLNFLYIVDADFTDGVTYFAEGCDPESGEIDNDFGVVDKACNFSDSMYDTIDTGEFTMTDIYDSGDYGMLVSGFAPVRDEAGKVVAAVGADLNVDDVIRSSARFGFMMIVIVAGLCAAISILLAWYIRRTVGRPVTELIRAAEKMAAGDVDIDITSRSDDELGRLQNAFRNMMESTGEQAGIMESLADGDLTVEVRPRSDKDKMSLAIERLVERFNDMFGEINNSAAQVSAVSRQIAEGAQALAFGAVEQASHIEKLLISMNVVSEKAGFSSESAAKAQGSMRLSAEKGSEQMRNMTRAVKEINDASQSVRRVIKAIDDIAFQTNILALNAAVEAARAGQHGKGFAVVAEEVRALAKRSSDSAQDTETLIADTMEKAALGVRIAEETHTSLREIVSGIEEQGKTISEINLGLDRVSRVVAQNSSMAEESAAASQEMSSQADALREMVSRFKLKASAGSKGGHGAEFF